VRHLVAAARLLSWRSRRPAPPQPRGMGISDGRGWGPYGKGYVLVGEIPHPLGPGGEILSLDFDFTPGPSGYIPIQRPRKTLPGYQGP